jgi:hypothetical protein
MITKLVFVLSLALAFVVIVFLLTVIYALCDIMMRALFK